MRFFSAIIASTISSLFTSPIGYIVDRSVIETDKYDGVLLKSLRHNILNFKIDKPLKLSFITSILTLATSNLFKTELPRIISACIITSSISLAKECSLAKSCGIDNVRFPTKFLFVARDSVALSTGMMCQRQTFILKSIYLCMSQVPCTLINSIAIETLQGRKFLFRNVYHGVKNSIFVRMSRTLLNMGIGLGINNRMMNIN